MKNISKVFSRFIVAIIAIGCFYCLQSCDTGQSFKIRKSGNLIGVLPFDSISSTTVRLTPELKFDIVLASPRSKINKRDLAWLMKNGYAVDSTFCIDAGLDLNDSPYMSFHVYKVDLPIWKWHVVDSMVTDSTKPGGHKLLPYDNKPGNLLRNVTLYATDNDDDNSILGLDIFVDYVLEYRYFENAIALYRELPDQYEKLVPLSSNRSFLDNFSSVPDYYVNFEIEGKNKDYRLLTRSGNTAIKLPKNESPANRRSLPTVEVKNINGKKLTAEYNPDGWVGIGDRAGSFTVFYFDDKDSPDYYINPFLFFNQNIAISFPDEYLYILPHTDTPKRIPAVISASKKE